MFDSQQLTAGTDWAAAITRGLEGADVLVLVGSQQSLESAAVRHEWTTALTQGKKLVVALFERVALPPELHTAAAVVDFRRSFSEALARLQGVLRGEVALQETPKALGYRVLAFPVRMIAFSLVVPGLAAAFAVGVAAFHAPYDKQNIPVGWVLGLYVVLLCAFLMHRARTFLRRDFRRGQVQAALVTAGIVLPLATTKVLWTSAIDETYLLVATTLLTVLSLILALIGSWLLQRSSTIFRWLPTGQARLVERVYLLCACLILFALTILSVHVFILMRQEDEALLRSVVDAMQSALPQESQDFRVRWALGAVRLLFFSPIAATLFAFAMAVTVIGLGWLTNAVTSRLLSRRAALWMACALSLGLLNLYLELAPFSEVLGLIGIVLVTGELRYAWLPAIDRSFRDRAREALTDLVGWRQTMNAIGLVVALLFLGMVVVLSFA